MKKLKQYFVLNYKTSYTKTIVPTLIMIKDIPE